LVVEDNESIREYLENFLSDHGYLVESVGDGASALRHFEKSTPDLVILDLGLPNISGESVCREIKKNSPSTPVIILTAKNKSPDIIEGFNLGADDYISKPFVGDELLARVKVRLKDTIDQEASLKVGELELDRKNFVANRDGLTIKLTPKEFQLLEYLMVNKGRIIPREMILNRVWLYSPDIESRAVDVYVGYLRKKIDGGFKKKMIQTLRGFGYAIRD
ncbi:response regulator transcription factor, partial [Candidatus Curtissbacteria bacterium]|nr:response regulator transcription factor [Candidatus Curtissbacteria bacterium]